MAAILTNIVLLPCTVYAEFESKIMGFVDDVEVYFTPDNSTVEYRSASRLGEGDFDVNRKRIRDFRVALQNIVSWSASRQSVSEFCMDCAFFLVIVTHRKSNHPPSWCTAFFRFLCIRKPRMIAGDLRAIKAS